MNLPLLLALVAAAPAFETVAPGVEHAVLKLVSDPLVSDGRVDVVRVDPKVARVELRSVVHEGGAPRTAAAWADALGAVAVINAGMFELDGTGKSVGHMRVGGAALQERWHPGEQSALVVEEGVVDVVDLDTAAGRERVAKARNVLQALRLMKGEGVNVWTTSGRKKRWSEAAIAVDGQGRLLLLHTRTPLPMVDFVEKVRALKLGVVRMLHAEGGPEASLSLRGTLGEKKRFDRSGSYETGFFESDNNLVQWVLPNVVVVRGGDAAR